MKTPTTNPNPMGLPDLTAEQWIIVRLLRLCAHAKREDPKHTTDFLKTIQHVYRTMGDYRFGRAADLINAEAKPEPYIPDVLGLPVPPWAPTGMPVPRAWTEMREQMLASGDDSWIGG